jgi:trimethylamine:corrinoid methyltransferase-like protein
MLKRFLRETEISETTALVEDIREVGIGGHYLGQKSTTRFARAGELWQPRVFRRGTFASHSHTTLVQDATDRAREILARHEVLPLPDDVDRHIDRVISDYAQLA